MLLNFLKSKSPKSTAMGERRYRTKRQQRLLLFAAVLNYICHTSPVSAEHSHVKLSSPANSTTSRITRCAFDIGSTETKLSIAHVVLSKSKHHKVTSVEKIFEYSERVLIKDSIVDDKIPDATVASLTKVLSSLKQRCIKEGATQFVGVATSGFRAASQNGESSRQRIADATGITLTILSGKQEALLGLRAAEGFVAAWPDKQRSNLVVWDIGGGSMQFAAKQDLVSLELGTTVFDSILRTKLGREQTKLPTQPLTAREIQQSNQLVQPFVKQIPLKLRELLRSKSTIVIGLGKVHSIAIAGVTDLQHVNENTAYQYQQLLEALPKLADCDDTCIQKRFPNNRYPEQQVGNVILVSSLMRELKMNRVYPAQLNLTDGLLRDDRYWSTNPKYNEPPKRT